jgi:putative DNA-invertase from lambdoid prophage Rac
MLQLGQKAAIYCRVSTADQSCERQERDLRAFAELAGYEAVGVFKETGSGAKLDRVERKGPEHQLMNEQREQKLSLG